MADGSDELLINLNSPEKSNNLSCQNTYLKNPLIPGPDVNCNLEINNPFDVVAISAENWDPFELVLHESLKKINVNHEPKCESNKKPAKSYKIFKTPSPRKEKVEHPRKVLRSQSVTDNIMCFNSPITASEKVDSDSSKTTEDACSIRDRIKKVVKRRVSECIESALNPSFSHPDLRKPEASPLKSMNNILSQIACISPETNVDESVTLSCYEPLNNNSQDTSNIPQELGIKARGIKSHEENVIKNEKQCILEVLENAKQLSFALHNMSLSDTSKIDDIDSKFLNQEEENLIDVKPPWEDIDESPLSSESEDSSIGLPKVRLFYMKKKENRRNEISAEELAQYKKRIRASIDGNISCDEDTPIEKTVDESSIDKPNPNNPQNVGDEKNLLSVHKELEKLEPVAAPKPTPVLPEPNELRPKKRGSILKKGPMKALVPLQKMTKTIAEKMSSPLKKKSHQIASSANTKQDSSFSNSLICPVAASTPNSKVSSQNRTTETPNRSRLSRKEIGNSGRPGSAKRSVSDSRMSNGKLPFSALNSNVTTNKKSRNRPHTAPSNSANISTNKSSPKTKNSSLRKNTLAINDKENRMHVF